MNTKPPLILGILVPAAVILALATQPWITVQLAEGAAATTNLAMTGQEVNASLSPIVLAALAGALALTIAGRAFRIVLGALIALLGAGAAWIAAYVYLDTAANYAGRVAEATGLAGSGHADLVQSVTVSPLVVIALILGTLLMLAGLGVAVLGGRWKSAGRKYASHADSPGDPEASRTAGGDRFDDWDRLSDGDDPSDTGAGDDPRP